MARMKRVVICLDRDGTLIYDDKYNLGRTNDWKTKVKILPGVVGAIRKLRRIPNVTLHMITNQPNVGALNFKLLTEQRANQVCEYVMQELKRKGAVLDGYQMCPYVNNAYMKKRPDRKYDPAYIKESSCMKPNPGMVFRILKEEKIETKDAVIYVIGDRISDVNCGINAGGTGILVPFVNEKDELKKIDQIKDRKKAYFAKNLNDATQFIFKKEGVRL